jgi:molybdopterin/thiamine biosynthesis adenylyltransferase
VGNEIRFPESKWSELVAHVLADGAEHAAILICGTVTTTVGANLLVQQVIPLTDDDLLESSDLHLSVDPVSLARAAKHARDRGATVVVCHSHPFPGVVRPSFLDLDTERELCGVALVRRLAPRPVGALIVGPDGISARIYTSDSAQAAVVRVLGDEIVTPDTSDRAQISSATTHDRQVRAWGEAGQAQLAGAHVAVVGVGGTGSQVAVQLAHLGVQSFMLVDGDRVDETNLSRIVGSTSSDVGVPKVDVLERAIHNISPKAQVSAVRASVLDIDPMLLARATVVFCCTDGHGSRALLTELCLQYLVPVIDLGVELIPNEGAVTAGGGVRVLMPGDPCLHCLGTLDPALVREEYMTDEERAIQRRHGYLRGSDQPTPSVIALNGVVASLAVLEFCHLLTGLLGSARTRLLYRANARALSTASVEAAPNCHACGAAGLLAVGDAVVPPTRWRGDTLPGNEAS